MERREGNCGQGVVGTITDSQNAIKILKAFLILNFADNLHVLSTAQEGIGDMKVDVRAKLCVQFGWWERMGTGTSP